MPREGALVLTCEHATNAVPAPYRALFRGAGALLASHRGWDPGALALARRIGRATGTRVHAGRATRLLVDLNRSAHHRALHSELVRDLPESERAHVRERYYEPYRRAVEAEIARGASRGRVLHLALHSFTPSLDGKPRTADVGILYDPARRGEQRFASELVQALRQRAPALRVRRNNPYLGTSDGFVTYLRRRFPAARYVGIELEINQAFPLGDPQRWRAMQHAICAALVETRVRIGI